MFYGRERELKFFEDKYAKPAGQLIVLYGRRRVGKTALLRKFCEDKPHIFYTCREITDNEQLKSFSARILGAGSPAAQYTDRFRDWESAFTGFAELPPNGNKKLLIIDEFPYMARGNPSVASVLQVLWDEGLCGKNLMIILCGSAMSFIEKQILSEKNPLYGRATGIYKIEELPYYDAARFFPGYSNRDKMLSYSILGGIPHYLAQFDPAAPLRENIINNILTKGCVLYSEPEFLLRQELREVSLYNTIIEAVALGNTGLNDIHNKTGIDKTKLSVYLKNLIELAVIEREFPALTKDKQKTVQTRGLYRLTDNFFRFWYRFIFTNLSDLETGGAENVYEHVFIPVINDFAAEPFEAVCRVFLRRMSQKGGLPFYIAKMGRWWGKLPGIGKDPASAAAEIDIIASDEKRTVYLSAECKFKNAKTGTDTLAQLINKTNALLKDADVYYALFSNAGFSDALLKEAQDNNKVLLYTLDDLFGISAN